MLLLLDQVQREDVSESQEDSAWVKGAWTAAESLCSCWLKGTSGSIYIKRLLLQTSLESTALHTQTFFLGPFSFKKSKCIKVFVRVSVCIGNIGKEHLYAWKQSSISTIILSLTRVCIFCMCASCFPVDETPAGNGSSRIKENEAFKTQFALTSYFFSFMLFWLTAV